MHQLAWVFADVLSICQHNARVFTEAEAYVRKYARSGTSASREALGLAGQRRGARSSLIIFGEAAATLLSVCFFVIFCFLDYYYLPHLGLRP